MSQGTGVYAGLRVRYNPDLGYFFYKYGSWPRFLVIKTPIKTTVDTIKYFFLSIFSFFGLHKGVLSSSKDFLWIYWNVGDRGSILFFKTRNSSINSFLFSVTLLDPNSIWSRIAEFNLEPYREHWCWVPVLSTAVWTFQKSTGQHPLSLL